VSPRTAPRLPNAFRRLACSNLAAQFSEQVALASAPLVAVLLLGAGPAETGYLQSAQTLPFLLLSLAAGVVADRFSRQRLMAGAEALRAASLLGILLLILFGLLSMPLLAVLGFLGAVGTVAYSVAAPALIPTLVPRDQLAAANRWLELARSSAFAAGPAIGGAIVGWMGGSAAYVLATFLSLVAVVLLAGLAEPHRPAPVRRHLLQELREGAGFVATHPLLRPILITSVFFNTSWFILQAVYVAYAVHNLGLTAAGVGITLGVYGAGMVAGALAADRLARHLSYGVMIASGPLSALFASLVMVSTIWFPSGVLAGLSFFLFGAGPILWTITTATLRQAVTPNAMLGRISAVVMTASFGSRPIGAAIGAMLAARFGVEACLVASAAGFLIQFLVILASPVPRLSELPQAA
jgi:MFS family permease